MNTPFSFVPAVADDDVITRTMACSVRLNVLLAAILVLDRHVGTPLNRHDLSPT